MLPQFIDKNRRTYDAGIVGWILSGQYQRVSDPWYKRSFIHLVRRSHHDHCPIPLGPLYQVLHPDHWHLVTGSPRALHSVTPSGPLAPAPRIPVFQANIIGFPIPGINAASFTWSEDHARIIARFPSVRCTGFPSGSLAPAPRIAVFLANIAGFMVHSRKVDSFTWSQCHIRITGTGSFRSIAHNLKLSIDRMLLKGYIFTGIAPRCFSIISISAGRNNF